MIDYVMSKGLNERLLMSLYPRNGVSWDAPLHPNTPRNFATSIKTWTEFQQAVNNGLTASDDFAFEIKFTVNTVSNSSIFYNSATSGVFMRIYLYSGGNVHVWLGLGSYAVVYNLFPVGGIVAGGTYTINVTAIGNNVAFSNGWTVKNVTIDRTTGVHNDLVSSTSIDGSIHYIFLKNLTTSTIVWQASRSDLYITNYPWPSNVPRNFATEAETWYDLGLASATIGMDDWELSGEMYINSLTAGKNILYRSTEPRFGFYVASTAQIRIFNYTASLGSERIYDYNNPPIGEWISWKMQRVGGWLRWFINGVEVKSLDKTGAYVAMDNSTALSSNEDCNLRNCYFKNLATGKTLWSYPSYAERTRLVTMANVLTSNGIFEGATTGVARRVKTALDLRGNSTSKTFICRCYIPSHADGSLRYSGLITQGNYTSTPFVFRLTVYESAAGDASAAVSYRDSSGVLLGVTSTSAAVSSALNRWSTFAGVFDYAAGQIRLCIDGVLIASESVTMSVWRQDTGDLSEAVSIMHDIATLYASGHKIAWAMVYEGALTDQEILMHNSIV